MRLNLPEEDSYHVYTLSYKHVCPPYNHRYIHNRCILFGAGVIMYNLDKITLCQYLSESWSHNF